MINSPPQVMPLTVDLHEHLVQVPAPSAGFHAFDAALADLGGEDRAKAEPPEPDGLMADVDATLVKQILNIPQRQREPDIHHDRQADDFRAAVEIREWVAFCHARRL